jgi:hypothetical protein
MAIYWRCVISQSDYLSNLDHSAAVWIVVSLDPAAPSKVPDAVVAAFIVQKNINETA